MGSPCEGKLCPGRQFLLSFFSGPTSTEEKESFCHCLLHRFTPIPHLIFILCYAFFHSSFEKILDFQPFSLIDSFKYIYILIIDFRERGRDGRNINWLPLPECAPIGATTWEPANFQFAG